MSLVKGLEKNGYTIEIACPPGALAQEAKLMGVKVHQINIKGPISPLHDLICIKDLKTIISQGHYDVIHFHGSKAGLVGRAATIMVGCKNTVLTVHNFIVYQEVSLPKKIMFRYGERLLSCTTSRIITVSEALKNDLVANFKIKPDKITPIYNGIDLKAFLKPVDRGVVRKKYGIEPQSIVIGTLARMAPQKGLKYLIEAVPLLCKDKNTRIIVGGDGPLKTELEKIAEKLGVRDQIIFPGLVQNTPEFLVSLDVFVMPSIAEGLSITTMEAMAAGLPVVASRVGGLPELVRENLTGFLVKPRDSMALAESINKLTTNLELRTKFGEAARNIARTNFDQSQMINKTSELYHELYYNLS